MTSRLKIAVRGAVQGVGFRPFVHRLAGELGLSGWVNNSSAGVLIEAEGRRDRLEHFLARLQADRPPRSFIQSLEYWWLDAAGYAEFVIRPSDPVGGKTAIIMPDLATCPDCLRELFDAGDRRHLYPFINCTHCGPRFSIIEALPYDRANTSMKRFVMCPECEREYRDQADRRFHAEPIACPKCGPSLALWDRRGTVLATRHEALLQAARIVRDGRILALKGIGGFQLLVDARNEEAVRRLRERKQREEKPFAVMYPTLRDAGRDCLVSDLEARMLTSSEAPIVLLESLAPLAPSVAPCNPNLGVMLPYSPLHHLLMRELAGPVVATSGNLSDEPICVDEREARQRLGNIADAFLVHDRPIVRHVDDSVARVVLGREQVLRRARGYAPLPVRLAPGRPATARDASAPVLAVGAHLKNTVALAIGPQVFVSQHIGDLETAQSYEAFVRVVKDFERLYEAGPGGVASDAHPDYLSTRFAKTLVAAEAARTGVSVQHHVAHVLACLAENELAPPVLGISWDGTGYGLDGTVWGGEFFLVTEAACRRVAHFRQFRLPGGEQAVKEPRRAALGLLYELYGGVELTPGPSRMRDGTTNPDLPPNKSFSPGELAVLTGMLKAGVNSPLTSSVGRLFDAVASLLGLRQNVRFEGQAAMELEFTIDGVETNEAYPFGLLTKREATAEFPLVVDWGPMVTGILADATGGLPSGLISARFHNTLAEVIVAVAKRFGQPQVALSGGCFQNRYLLERTVAGLEARGFRPYWHQRIPPNDGGISLGQIVATLMGVK